MLPYTCVSPDRAFYHSTCYILEACAFSHLCIHSMFQGGDAFLSLNLISAYANKGEKVTQQGKSDHTNVSVCIILRDCIFPGGVFVLDVLSLCLFLEGLALVIRF
jgi:hypothetical protein